MRVSLALLALGLLPIAAMGGVVHDFVGGGGSVFDVGFGDDLFERVAYLDTGAGPTQIDGATGSSGSISYDIANAVVTNGSYTGVETTYVLTNTGASALTISLFQYTDMDVGGASNDVVDYFPPPGAGWDWTDPADPGVYQYLTPGRSHFEAGPWPVVQDGIEAGGPGYTLPDVADCGPDDCSAAGQWTMTLDPQASATISSTLQGIPEPATMGLLSLGALAMIRRRR